ncbi:hypothetical protein OS21_12520 [Dickeya oryzae]
MKRREFLAGSLATVVSLPFYVRSEKWVAEAKLVSTTMTPLLNSEPTVLLADSAMTQQATTLNINLVSGTLVNFSYHTLTGNQPSHYQNQVFLWPVSDNEIPWSSPAIAQSVILLNQPDGDQNLDNIAISSGAYILGYAVGPEYAQDAWSRYLNVVASAYIPAQLNRGYRDDTALSRCSITPAFVGVSSIACNFFVFTWF